MLDREGEMSVMLRNYTYFLKGNEVDNPASSLYPYK